MSTQRVLLLSYIVLGLLIALVLGHSVSSLPTSVTAFNFLHRDVFGQESFWSYVIGFVLGVAVTLFCWTDRRVKEPATQVVEELQRVTWPSMAETRSAALAVIVATLICSALLGVFDSAWSAVTTRIYAAP
jgi:preprotein translocase SecE subunit